MFDQNDQNQQATTAPMPEPVAATPVAEPQTVTATPEPTTAPVPASDATATPSVSQSDSTNYNISTLPTPTDDPATASTIPAEPISEPAAIATPEPTTTSTSTDAGEGADSELMNIKKEALQSLSPLVSKLDQSPEEKYRTTMMLIRASDDKTLIQAAYNAAKDIADDKERAQALLDLVNEINYFTQYGKK